MRTILASLGLILWCAAGPTLAQPRSGVISAGATADSTAAHRAAADSSAFVRVENGQFVLEGRPYYFIGANLWFGMNLGQAGHDAGRARLLRELDQLQALGVNNLRVMAASEGPSDQPWRVHPAVQNEPRVYDETLLVGLDFLLDAMAQRNMKAVLVLNNFFQWSGGMAQYVSWATGTPIPYPEQDGHTWDDFQNYSAQFFANTDAKRLFLDYIYELLHRTNTITGRSYRDDPTIMAWQLANEPRGFALSPQYVEWVDQTAGFIQLMDPNHLVSLGGEGKVVPSNGTAFPQVSASPHLDYLTIHLWLENWGWYDPSQPAATFGEALGLAMAYVADHMAVAATVNKPVVLEEFGLSRDEGRYESSAPTTYRDHYFQMLFAMQHKMALESGLLAGLNLWAWSGEGQPRAPGAAWQPGDPFTGDPPHEKQGWYGVYTQDTSTLDLIRRYTRLVDRVHAPSVGLSTSSGAN
ncbi:MAG: hypothetical protein AAF970_00660 [Bacteroidota bacterium]